MPTRRAILRSCAAAFVLTGCRLRGATSRMRTTSSTARPSASPSVVRAKRPTVTIIDPTLSAFRGELERALRVSAMPFSIRFLPEVGTLEAQAASADLVSGWMWQGFRSTGLADLFIPLDPLLRAANFNTTQLLGGTLPALHAENGALIELPWHLGEMQFYVNDKAVAALGLDPRAPWTLKRLQTAAFAAVGKDRRQHPFTGVGWGAANLWAAIIAELGGALYSSSAGRVQLTAVTEQAEQFVAFCRQTRWAPSGADTISFMLGGFAASPKALFAFAQPWTMGNLRGDRIKKLVPADFPSAAPARAPAVGSDVLAVSAGSRHPELAVRFILWLYRPEQQKLFASFGVPPVINDEKLYAFWDEQRKEHPFYPIFYRNGYFDFLDLLPAVPLRAAAHSSPSAQWSSVFYGAFQRMYHGAKVALELKQLQGLVNQAMTRS